MDEMPLFDPEELALLFRKTKPYRRYDLIFENGKPVFRRNEFDIIFDEALDAVFDAASCHGEG